MASFPTASSKPVLIGVAVLPSATLLSTEQLTPLTPPAPTHRLPPCSRHSPLWPLSLASSSVPVSDHTRSQGTASTAVVGQGPGLAQFANITRTTATRSPSSARSRVRRLAAPSSGTAQPTVSQVLVLFPFSSCCPSRLTSRVLRLEQLRQHRNERLRRAQVRRER